MRIVRRQCRFGPDPSDPGDMLYTSARPAHPRASLTSHDAVLRTAYASALTRAYEDGRRILFSLPCYHMFGYVEGLLSVMFVGGAIIPQTTFSAEGYFARYRTASRRRHPVRADDGRRHARKPSAADYDLSSLKAILCGAAPAPVWVWRQIADDFGVSEITTGYGMTECGGAMTLTRPEDPLALTHRDCRAGRKWRARRRSRAPTHSSCTKPVDPATGADAPPEKRASSCPRGPTPMLGYWDQPEQTAATLRDGWLFSGDLGRVRDDGYIQVTGRSKELYKSGGELVMPKEIEDLLACTRGHQPGVRRRPASTTDGAKSVASWSCPAPDADSPRTTCSTLCRSKLARFKVPKRVVFYRAEELPTTPTGKVQKFKLVQQLTPTPRR